MNLKRKLVAVVAALAGVSVAQAVPITVAGFDFDDTDFADVVLFEEFVGTLEPVDLAPDPGTGTAAELADAVLGSDVNKFANGVGVELGFTDNVLTNIADAFDVLVFEIGADGDGFLVRLTFADSLPELFILDGSRIGTGELNSIGPQVTAYLIDLSDLGVGVGNVSTPFLSAAVVLSWRLSREYPLLGHHHPSQSPNRPPSHSSALVLQELD